jgi:phosphoglycolate phosphatase-like HAD superfamily hydrolase
MVRQNNIIVDLDNTLALDEWRRPYIQSHGWEGYFELCGGDKVNESVATTLAVLQDSGFKVHILTSRSESVYKKTVEWLKEHHIDYVNLTMRPAHHYQDTEEGAVYHGNHTTVKLEMATKLGLKPENTLMVLEDTDEVVTAWREVGYNCWQVREQGEHYHAKS